jgi:hypothetical protein
MTRSASGCVGGGVVKYGREFACGPAEESAVPFRAVPKLWCLNA